MQPDQDDQNQEPQGRSFNIKLSRDALILTGALGFLALALVLAFLIPTSSDNPSSQPTTNATLSAGRVTSVVPSTGAPPTGATAAGPGAYPSSSNGTPAPQGQNAQGVYPGPGATSAANQAAQATAAEGSDDQTTEETDSSETDTADEDATDEDATDEDVTTVALGQPTANSQPTSGAAQPTSSSGYPAPPAAGSTPVSTFEPVRPTTAGNQAQATVQPSNTPEPPNVAPTDTREPPTAVPPTREPTETSEPTEIPEPTETPEPTQTPAPTTPPIDIIRGTVRWTPDKGPIFVSRDLSIPRGSTLIIEPGTEVRLGVGVSMFVDGKLLSLGRPDSKVTFLADRGQRWEGIFANPGSAMTFDSTQISGAGSGGTMLTSEGGDVLIRGSRFYDNGGNIHITNSRLEMRDSEIAGNDMPYGAALEGFYGATENTTYSYAERNFVTLAGNRIGGNRQADGAPGVKLTNTSRSDTLNLDIQRNFIVGGSGANMILSTDGPLKGSLTCNTLRGQAMGLDLRSETKQIPGFDLVLRQNYFDDHTPPIIPEYLKYGIGRGLASEVVLDARGNWWGDPSGPYHPQTNQLGRGDSVGVNIDYSGWLTAPPDCVPR